MPKEQGRFGERAVRSASKNAKDRSNSATLRASRGGGAHAEPPGVGDVSRRMLRCDSEKDSGYSEAGSDSVHTDVDDQRSSVSEPQGSSSTNNNRANAAGHNMPAYEELAPIYIIKNLVVKPSRPEQLLHGPLAWGGGWHGLTGAKAPTQLLLIQQQQQQPPALPASSSAAPTPPSSQTARQGEVKSAGGHSSQSYRSKKSYLPILNSYPRIAPHPRKESHEGKSGKGVKACGGGEGHSQSKRVCTEEEKREAVSTTTHLLKPHQPLKECRVHSHSQHKARGHNSFPTSPHCPLPTHASSSCSSSTTTTQHKSLHCQQRSGSDSVGSPSVSSSQMPSPPSSSDSTSSSSSSPPSSSSSMPHSPYRLLPDSSSTRQRRFLNTAEILSQSGLLAITLRTKELLKQNAATEREIAQLRQHTHLLCQAAQADQSSDGLDKLLQAMTKSASYPELDLNKMKALGGVRQEGKTEAEEVKEKEKNVKSTKTHSDPEQLVSLHTIDDGTSPPSPLFAPSPEAEGLQHTAADDPLDLMSIVSFHRSLPELGQGQTFMDKDISDLAMFPESSTHHDYLL